MMQGRIGTCAPVHAHEPTMLQAMKLGTPAQGTSVKLVTAVQLHLKTLTRSITKHRRPHHGQVHRPS
jgi:hypothetical protein